MLIDTPFVRLTHLADKFACLRQSVPLVVVPDMSNFQSFFQRFHKEQRIHTVIFGRLAVLAAVGTRVPGLGVVLEPISRNRQQHCFKILWSFNLCPSGAVHRWSMVATLGVRLMASPELIIQCPQIRVHFPLYFSNKDQIARRREWFSGVSSRAFL